MNEMDNELNIAFRHFRPVLSRVIKFWKLIAGENCKRWVFQPFNVLIMFVPLVLFLGAMYSSYLYSFPYYQPVMINNNGGNNNKSRSFSSQCNVFEGKWVRDETYPLYNASACPFAELGFNCLGNGRKDKEYLKWRWVPKDCDILRFDASVVLKKLRGKRIVFVGDSLSRTQWESMICMLMTGVEDKRSVYEVNGNKITKQIRHLNVWFSNFNFTVEFYRSVFLVQPGSAPRRAPKRVKWTLKLDTMDDISREWIDSDVLIFNSGHWWMPTKLFDIQGLVFPSWWENEARNVYKRRL